MTRTWEQIPGWFDWPALYRRAVERAESGAVFVEVGSWLGRSTVFLAELIRRSGKDIQVVAVDHCLGSPDAAARFVALQQAGRDTDPSLLAKYHAYHLEVAVLQAAGGNTAGVLMRNLRESGVLPLVSLVVADSPRAARLLAPGSCDLIFLDGGHDQASVQGDLQAWWPRLRPGGAMAGHDYTPDWPGVRAAVHAFFGVSAPGWPCRDADAPSCWYVRKDTQ
ncbi:MAG: class I SAM-dependent methyltransferase [Gemmataceae bacterium]|nr:class I SAM-dependent methyltransferase [Gemmataceae bacterium]